MTLDHIEMDTTIKLIHIVKELFEYQDDHEITIIWIWSWYWIGARVPEIELKYGEIHTPGCLVSLLSSSYNIVQALEQTRRGSSSIVVVDLVHRSLSVTEMNNSCGQGHSCGHGRNTICIKALRQRAIIKRGKTRMQWIERNSSAFVGSCYAKLLRSIWDILS